MYKLHSYQIRKLSESLLPSHASPNYGALQSQKAVFAYFHSADTVFWLCTTVY